MSDQKQTSKYQDYKRAASIGLIIGIVLSVFYAISEVTIFIMERF